MKLLTILSIIPLALNVALAQRRPVVRPGREGPTDLDEKCSEVGIHNANECDWYEEPDGTQYLIYLVRSRKNWHDAREYCQNDNADLAWIHSCELDMVIRRLFKTGRVWIGGTRPNCHRNTEWTWTDGSSITDYENWGADFERKNYEPNCRAGNHRSPFCIQMDSKYYGGNGWNDSPCSNSAAFVCMKYYGD